MSQDTIESLVSDLRPVRRGAMARMLGLGLAAGAVVAAMIMIPWIGLRTDLVAALGSATFWIKFAYTLALTAIGFRAALPLLRPDGTSRWSALVVAATFVAMLGAGTVQWIMAPAAQRADLMFGGTALVCPFLIVALSMPTLAITLWIARRFAPTSPTIGGLVAGLAAGGAGAWVYGFHCGEFGLLFLALWYTLGIALVAALGALIGRFVLRW